MNKTTVAQQAKTASFLPPAQGMLQRKCACGNHTVAGGECAACAKRNGGLQRKLAVGASNDSLEQEADRIADKVMAAPAQSEVSEVPPPLQRFAEQATRGLDAAPGSVNETLASPGRSLEPALRQDMEQRFGYDFSRVRVHSGTDADQSARDVSAKAYTVGHNMVFGARQFAPGTHAGQRLIAHELAHVIQQTAPSLLPLVSSGKFTSGRTKDSITTGIHHLTSLRLQRDVDSEAEHPWNKLSPSVRKEAQKLYDDCDDAIGVLDEAQMVRVSNLRNVWLNFLRRIRSRIEELDSDPKFAGVKNSYDDYMRIINRVTTKSREEWSAVEKRYLDEHRWLLSANVKSNDSIEAAKYLDEIYQQTKPSIPFLVTEEDYAPLKNALNQQEYIRVGALRGARSRARQLVQMMNTVADLLRKGEDANKYIPEWSDRVLEEAAYLGSFAKLATEARREYGVELADLRKQLLEKQQETSKVKPREESGLEKVADVVEGGVEAIAGIFVEAAKEAVDLVQINLHVVTFGKYEPKFISDMAEAAKQGASTADLLKGMVKGIVETPSRFLKACRDGDWKAIGRESVQLYMLAKTIKEAPETLKKVPQAVKKLPELLAKTRESLRILRERTVALGLKKEGRFSPEPPRQPVLKPAPQADSASAQAVRPIGSRLGGGVGKLPAAMASGFDESIPTHVTGAGVSEVSAISPTIRSPAIADLGVRANVGNKPIYLDPENIPSIDIIPTNKSGVSTAAQTAPIEVPSANAPTASTSAANELRPNSPPVNEPAAVAPQASSTTAGSLEADLSSTESVARTTVLETPSPKVPARTTSITPEEAADNLRARYSKLDQTDVGTFAGLVDIFRRTMSGKRTRTPRPGQYLSTATRGATGELDAIRRAQNDPTVIRIRVVPPQGGPGAPRTPDLQIDRQLPDGSVVTQTGSQGTEIRTVTGGRVGYQPVGSRQNTPATAESIANAIRAKIFPSGKLSQIEAGGNLEILVRRGGPTAEAMVASAVNQLNPRLVGARFVRELRFHLTGGRTVTYVRAPDGTFVAAP